MSATACKSTPPEDWHRADIKASLEKAGYTLASLARKNGYNERSFTRVFSTPWPAVERIIAKIIKIHPSLIWPSRYERGKPLIERTARVRRKVAR